MRLRLFIAGLIAILIVSCSNTSTTNQNTDTTAPATPTGFAVTARDSSLGLSWVANTESDLDHYDVYSGTQESNLTFAKRVSSSETNTMLEGLSNGTVYYAAVSAVDSFGNKSALSVVRSATPTAASTGESFTPTNFTVVAGDGEIRVSWSSGRDDIREYVVYWGTSSSDLSQNKRADNNSQSVTITGLSNGTEYFVAMSAVDTLGNESDRTAVAASTPLDSNTQPPSTPEALVVVPGDGKATVSWSANIEPDLSGYTAYWGTDETTLSQSKRVPATATSTEIIGLSNGTIYYVAMTASDTANSESERTRSQPVTPFRPDTTAPSISRTTPVNGAEIDSSITVKFNEAMDVGSVKVTLEPNVNLNAPVWSENASLLTLDPKDNFTYGSSYTVRVVGNDQAGNALSGSTSFSFTTRTIPDTTAPKVTSTSPDDGASTVPTTANISISFDEAMDQATVEGSFSIEPQVECTFLWVSDSSLMNCDPITELSFSTTYTVTLSVEAKDEAGNALSQQSSFSFTTASAPDATPPTIVNTSPRKDERGVALESSITVTFSESMDRVSVQQAFAITEPSYYSYNTNEFSWNVDLTEMKYTPNSGFSHGQDISWRISDIAEDRAGNTLQTSYVSNFKIRQMSYVTLYSVESLDGYVSSNEFVNTTFSTISLGNRYDNVFDRAYFTFDLEQLPEDVIAVTDAYFSPNQIGYSGYPENALTTPSEQGVILESVEYGNSLEFGDFEIPAVNFCGSNTSCNPSVLLEMYRYNFGLYLYSVGVTELVSYEMNKDAKGDMKVQLRLRFPRNQSTNYNSDYIYFNADYTPIYDRPYITVWYEHP